MKYKNGLPDYYEMLNISSEASSSEIKRAFRIRAKVLHPDTGKIAAEQQGAMQDLLKAYDTLTDPELRTEYDIKYRLAVSKNVFIYRDFLKMKADEPHYAGKLVFYDLLHDNDNDAIDIYESYNQVNKSWLATYLDREDFMDCAFLLAEAYEKKEEYYSALAIFTELVDYELEKPYFHHFFQEVLEKLRNILFYRLKVDSTIQMKYLEEITNKPLKKQDKQIFLHKLTQLRRKGYSSSNKKFVLHSL